MGKRLYTDFYDDFSTKWTVEIHQSGFVGTAGVMTMGPDPVVVRWQGDGWKSIVGSEATVTILGSDDLMWLFTTDGQAIKIVIKKDSVTWWEGFGLTEQYTDTFVYPRYFSLIATDRLGILEQELYPATSEDRESAILVIAYILQQTGLQLPIRVAMNLYEAGMSAGDTDDPLEQLEVRQDTIVDDELNAGDCKALLQRLCNSFQLKVFQSAGRWHVMRVPEMDDNPLAYRDFTYAGVYASNGDYAGAQIQETTVVSGGFRVMADAAIEAIAPFRSVNITENFDKRDSIFRGWSFPANEFTNATTLKHWLNSAGSPWMRYRAGDDYMIYAQTIAGLDNSKFIRSERIHVEPDYSSSEKWLIRMKWGSDAIGGTIIVRAVLEPDAGGNFYYARSSGAWDNSGTAYPLSQLNCPVAKADALQEIEAVLNSIPVAGDLYVTILAPYISAGSNFFYVSEVAFRPLPSINISLPATDLTTVDISANNNSVLTNYPVALTDTTENATYTKNQLAIYRAPLTVADVVTQSWWLNGAGTARTMIEWLYQWSDETEASFRFRGTIRGLSEYYKVVKMSEVVDQIFVWEDAEYSLRFASWYGTLIQHKGVLLSGDTSGASVSASSTISGGGGGGGSVVPVIPDTIRSGADTLVADTPKVISFSSQFTASFVLFISCLNDDATVGYQVTASDDTGFTVVAIDDCTIEYIAIKTI